jgi:DNA-binding transcriptional MocR family regulator
MQPIGAARSKKEFVTDALRTAILNGELTPGTRLIIDELAEQLGVSPNPYGKRSSSWPAMVMWSSSLTSVRKSPRSKPNP